MPRVIISSGHTDQDPGTVIDGKREVDFSRKIAKRITPYLRANGIISLFVPLNMDLQSRVKWVNQTGYQGDLNDVLIEIHINDEGKEKESGIVAWYDAVQHGQALQLAKDVTTSIEEDLDVKIEDIKQETEHPLGSIAILKATKPIGVLLECFYMDKEDDVDFLEDDEKVDRLGKSIARGIANYLGVNFNNSINLHKSTKSKTAAKKKVTTINNPKPKKTFGNINSVDNNSNANANNNNSVSKTNNTNNKSKSSKGYLSNFNKDPLGMSGGNDTANKSANSTANNQINQGNQSNSNFPSNSGSLNNNSSNAFGNNKKNMTREERKEMINKYYEKAFGKEPEQSDLNYFLNIGISEEQFLKRVLDSQDHKDLIENAKKYDKLKKKYDELETKFDSTDRGLKDQRNVMERLNSLLLQKNRALSQLQKRVQALTWRLEEYEAEVGKKPARVKYDRTFSERVWDFFSRKLG